MSFGKYLSIATFSFMCIISKNALADSFLDDPDSFIVRVECRTNPEPGTKLVHFANVMETIRYNKDHSAIQSYEVYFAYANSAPIEGKAIVLEGTTVSYDQVPATQFKGTFAGKQIDLKFSVAQRSKRLTFAEWDYDKALRHYDKSKLTINGTVYDSDCFLVVK